MAQAKAKRKIKAKVKTAKKAAAKSASQVRRAVKKSAPRARRKTSSLAKEFGALADKITNFGKAVFEQGAGKAGEIARAGLSAIGQGSEKLGGEIAAIKRAALSRAKL